MAETLNGTPWYQEGPWQRLVNDYLGAGGITAAQLGANLRTGWHSIPIFSSRIILSNDFADETIVSTGGSEKASGGILALDGAIFSLNRVNGATDKAARVVFKANTTGELQFPSFSLPPDLDDAQDMKVHLMLGKSGNTDTVTVDVQCFFGVGDTECGAATETVPQAKTEHIITLAAADVLAHPNELHIALVPSAHANDAIWLYGAAISYQRKS
jgi:hypothetical protein